MYPSAGADPEARPAPRPASGRLLALAYYWPMVPYTRTASPACTTAGFIAAMASFQRRDGEFCASPD